jgi:hypothetical protein
MIILLSIIVSHTSFGKIKLHREISGVKSLQTAEVWKQIGININTLNSMERNRA